MNLHPSSCERQAINKGCKYERKHSPSAGEHSRAFQPASELVYWVSYLDPADCAGNLGSPSNR